MRRLLLTSSLVLLLAVLAAGHAQQPEQAERQAKRLPALQPGEMIATALNKTVDFGGLDDPKTTLLEALDSLSKFYRMTISLNRRAFASEVEGDTLSTRIAEQPIPPLKTRLGTVVHEILSRVPTKSGATYIVRPDRLEITTVAAVRKEVWGESHRGPFLPLVHVTANAWELDDLLVFLAEQSGMNVTLDPRLGAKARKPITTHFVNQPLDTALFLITDMAELSFVQLDGTIHVTLPDRVAPLKSAWERLRGRSAVAEEKRPVAPAGTLPRDR